MSTFTNLSSPHNLSKSNLWGTRKVRSLIAWLLPLLYLQTYYKCAHPECNRDEEKIFGWNVAFYFLSIISQMWPLFLFSCLSTVNSMLFLFFFSNTQPFFSFPFLSQHRLFLLLSFCLLYPLFFAISLSLSRIVSMNFSHFWNRLSTNSTNNGLKVASSWQFIKRHWKKLRHFTIILREPAWGSMWNQSKERHAPPIATDSYLHLACTLVFKLHLRFMSRLGCLLRLTGTFHRSRLFLHSYCMVRFQGC